MQEIWDNDADGPDACPEALCDFSTLEDDEDECWGDVPSSQSTTGSTHKKRKITEDAARDAIPDASAPHRLDLLRAVPVEILYEIFMHVSPQDLLNLARTAHGLRALLLTRRAAAVWRTALRADPAAPMCPRGLAEPRWADLLWGGKTCLECEREGIAIMVAIIYLRRRACMRCLTDHLIPENQMETKFPALDPAVLRMIPSLQVKSSRAKMYWDEDVAQMSAQLEEHKQRVALGVPDGADALERFKAHYESDVVDRMEHAAVCEAWALERGYLL